MSTIKSSAENLTLNADGANNDIKFQSNGSEVASIDQAGTITATTFTGAATDATKLPLAGGTMTGDLLITKSSGDVSLTLYASENSGAREPILNLKGYATNSNPVINFGDHAGYAGAIEYENQDNSMRLWTNASEKVRIHSNGVTSVPNGIELGSGTDATAANTLDSYEEGTFEANLHSAGGSLSLGNNKCCYTKVGRTVTVNGRIDVSSVSSPSGELTITNLPFTSANLGESSGEAAVSLFIYNFTSGASGNWVGWIPQNSTSVYMRYGSGITPSGTAANLMKAGTEVRWAATYTAST